MVKNHLNRKEKVQTIRTRVDDAINKSMRMRVKSPDNSFARMPESPVGNKLEQSEAGSPLRR